MILLFFFSPLSTVYLLSYPRQSLPRQLSKSDVENFNMARKYSALNKGLCQALRLGIFPFSDVFSFFLESPSLCFLESSGYQEFSEKISGSSGWVVCLSADPQPVLDSVCPMERLFTCLTVSSCETCGFSNSVPAGKLTDDWWDQLSLCVRNSANAKLHALNRWII